MARNEMINATACTVTINLNNWHHGIHQVTGDMALRFNKATTADLERWAEILREAAEEMAAASKS